MATIIDFPTGRVVHRDPVADRKEVLLDVLDTMRTLIEEGEINEFVAASCDEFGIPQIHVCSSDFMGGVGLFEIGKQMFVEMG